MATELITWLRSKTRILHYLALAILRAVLTRWTAHYTAFRRLLELSVQLIRLADLDLQNGDESTRLLITGDRKAQQKAQRMVDVIKNPVFWQKLTLYVQSFVRDSQIDASNCKDQGLLRAACNCG
jgi:uncharacterized membrane protein